MTDLDIDQLRRDFQHAVLGRNQEGGETSPKEPLVIKYPGGEVRDEDFPRHADPVNARAVYALTTPKFMNLCPEGVDRREWLLLTLKAMGKHFTGGPRDEVFEQDIFGVLLNIHGLSGLARLFQVELPVGL